MSFLRHLKIYVGEVAKLIKAIFRRVFSIEVDVDVVYAIAILISMFAFVAGSFTFINEYVFPALKILPEPLAFIITLILVLGLIAMFFVLMEAYYNYVERLNKEGVDVHVEGC